MLEDGADTLDVFAVAGVVEREPPVAIGKGRVSMGTGGSREREKEVGLKPSCSLLMSTFSTMSEFISVFCSNGGKCLVSKF